jgi:hypothetical protein
MTDNPNSNKDTFQPIGSAALKLLSKLRVVGAVKRAKVLPDQSERKTDTARTAEETALADEQRRYVDYRLRELAAFEDRAAGVTPKRRR